MTRLKMSQNKVVYLCNVPYTVSISLKVFINRKVKLIDISMIFHVVSFYGSLDL